VRARNVAVLIWITAVAVVCLIANNIMFARGPSTPDERIRLVKVAQEIQNNPLDKSLHSDREWAIKWLIEVPDIHVEFCTNILGDFYKSKNKYSPEITTQLTLSTAAFVIQNPDKVSDRIAQFEAGVEGTLAAYKAILATKPEAKSKELDALEQRRNEGHLLEYVSESAKNCR
jgi:carboxypeptidase Q